MKKERVLHVIGDLGVGGAQAVLYQLWPSLRRSEKYEFELCLLNRRGMFGEKLTAEGATIHCLDSKRKYGAGSLLKLRQLIKQGRYDIVHAHLFPELPMVALATAGLPNLELVYTEHSANNRRRSWGLAGKLFDRLSYRKYSRVVAVNESAHRNLTAWLPALAKRSHVIPNSVRVGVRPSRDAAAKRALLFSLGLRRDPNVKLILFAGRLTHVKGADLLLSALAHIERRDYFCLIAGDGPDRVALEERADALGLGDHVKFLGARNDVTELLKAVDLLVLPSRWEGLPLIMLEAMAAGCPIVATSVDGTAEVLRDEVTALLVPSESVDALARGIERLLDSASLRESLAAEASLAVLNYAADKVAPRLLRLYDEVLQTTRLESSWSLT